MLSSDSNLILIKYCVYYKYNDLFKHSFSRQLLLSKFIVYRYLMGPKFFSQRIKGLTLSRLTADILETYTNKF